MKVYRETITGSIADRLCDLAYSRPIMGPLDPLTVYEWMPVFHDRDFPAWRNWRIPSPPVAERVIDVELRIEDAKGFRHECQLLAVPSRYSARKEPRTLVRAWIDQEAMMERSWSAARFFMHLLGIARSAAESMR